MQLIRTFLGFLAGAFVAALGLQYYRTGTIDLPALTRSLAPFVAGAGLGLVLLLMVLNLLARRK